MKESKDTLAYRFAEFSYGLKYGELPKEVIDAMKLYIMDWFGCAVGGLREPSSRMVLNLARELNGRSDSTVLGVGDKMEPTLAAFVNSNMSHSPRDGRRPSDNDGPSRCSGYSCRSGRL